MEDHRTGHRTDRLGVLLDQLDRAREIAQARLDGLASPASLPEGAPLSPRTGEGPLTDEQLDTVGFGQYPHGSDPEVPFITVIWEANLELIHHLAEIALLRDLYRTRPTGAR